MTQKTLPGRLNPIYLVRMVSQKDIYIAANMLIQKHGDGAEDYASEMMQSFIDKDDVKGASIWLSISAAIDDLRNLKRQGKPH